MKAVQYNQYGDPDVLIMAETGMPDIVDNLVIVRVVAVSINPLDWKLRQGEMKLVTGFKFPKGVGIDFSGIVEKTGKNIVEFKTGDAVFGAVNALKGGALAEYVAVKEQQIYAKPGNISFEQAATLPVVGCAATQIFQKLLPVRPGMEILVNGAGGGVGMFAAQLAKQFGADVTAVAGPKGIPFVEKWGCGNVVDYTKENVLRKNKTYDAIIDLSDELPFVMAKSIMKPSSVHVSLVPGPVKLANSIFNNLFSGKKSKYLLSQPNRKCLERLAEYASSGLDIIVGRTYEFLEYKKAYEESQREGYPGKTIIRVCSVGIKDSKK